MESLDSGIKKYTLQEILENLSKKHYDKVLKHLVDITGKCANTIKNYAKIAVDEKQEIPYGVAIILEDFFNLPPRGLCTISPSCKSLKDWLEEQSFN